MKKPGTQTIETRRLILRQFRPEDAEDMFTAWASDQEVTRFLTWPPHSDAGATRALLENWVRQYTDGGYFNWGIEWKENGRLIGNISVVRLDEETDSAEIGYCLGRAHWGHGFMPEALRAVMDYLFDTAEVNRIAACHDVSNPRSGRVMEKAGMKREGVLRASGKNNRGICDVVWYALLRSDRDPEKRSDPNPVTVRLAREDDLDQVNRLREHVNRLHTAGEPEIFKPGFRDELRDYIHVIRNDPNREIVVAEKNGAVCGYAVLNHIVRPENPYMFARDYLDIDEFGVGEDSRRQGIGSELIRFIRRYAREKGFRRLELNMWSFNRGALAFYEAAGFTTYRRYMETHL